MTARREIVTSREEQVVRRWITRAGSLILTVRDGETRGGLYSTIDNDQIVIDVSDLLALAELLKQEKP